MTAVKKWVFATFVLTFLVIIAGGIVRTTQSGMGCPDWPKCFGLWIPPTNASQLPPDFEKFLKAQDIDHTFNVYHTWIEYVNRLLGALLGLFAVIQTALLFFKRTSQQNAFRLSFAFLAGVILTGLFGAIVVKLNLAHVSISIHLFFAIVLAQIQLALYMCVKGKLFKTTTGTKMRRAMLILLAIIFTQSVLGTMVRMYIDDVSSALHFEQREAWLADMPIAFIIHRSFSWLVLASVLYANFYCRKVQALSRPIKKLTGIILLSVVTGIVLYYLDMPAVAQPLHLFLASMAITQIMFIILYTKNTTDLLKSQVV
ncbi:MAG: COX15/CtaA family protein [Ferruginibacter sp.]